MQVLKELPTRLWERPLYPVYSANLPVSVKGTVTVTLQEAVWESIRWPGRAIPELAEAPAFRTFIGLEKGRPICTAVSFRCGKIHPPDNWKNW